MKLVDKMVLFNRFLRENKNHKFDIDKEIQGHKEYFQEQKRFWKNKTEYEYIDDTLSNIIKLRKIYFLIQQRDRTQSKMLPQPFHCCTNRRILLI